MMLDPRRWALVWIVGFALVSIGYFVGSSKAERDFLLKEEAVRADAAEQATAKILAATNKLIAAQSTYVEEVKDGQEVLAATLHSIHTGSKRLSIGVKPGVCAKASGSTKGSNDTARAELSSESAEFLVSEAGRADDVARQLKLAQGVIRQLQEACKQ